MVMKYWRLYLSSCSCFLSSVCIGMIIFYPSSAFPDINSAQYGFHLSPSDVSWFASFAGLFALPGSLIVIPMVDNCGRKFASLINKIPMTFGWLLTVITFNVPTLGVSRALVGLAIGMEYAVIVVYISEIYPKHIRGIAASVFPVCVYFGGVLVNFLSIFINWRWTALVALATVTISVIFLLFMFETPRWLISQHDRSTAADVMKIIWCMSDSDEIDAEINEIALNIKATSASSFYQSLVKLVKRPLWRPLLITQLLMIFQQFTGNAYINNYTVTIIKAVASNDQANIFLSHPKYQACVISAAYLFGGIISMFVIDRLGRRILLLSSGTVISLSLVFIGAYYYIQQTNIQVANEYISWLPLTCLITYVFGFSFAYGGVPFILVGEVFPMSVRVVANGLGSFNHNLCYFIVVKVFPGLASFSSYEIFWIFAAVAIISVIFIYFFVPETKGRSLEEIQKLWYPNLETLAAESIPI